MDAVKAFNNELSGLYEVKPPISKAKMTSITRTAIKSIKFYKHVVQSVEKFILKCKPEYKIPGLYVIDSIVRQSRHQFGPDKDVFAPRFARNMQNTFSNLFSCPPQEKGKIIRVLNLWQKNQVFTPDVIQPLFDQLADPNNPIHRDPTTASNGIGTGTGSAPHLASPPHYKPGPQQTASSSIKISTPSDPPGPGWVKVAQTQIDAANKAIMELSGVAGMLGLQHKTSSTGAEILQQLQQLQHLILSQTPQKQDKLDPVLFDKKLLEFDYGDEDDENTSPHQPSANENINNILQNPEILRSLTAIQQHMTQAQIKQQQLEEEKRIKLREMKQQEEEFDKHLAQTVPKLPFAAECEFKQLGDGSFGEVDGGDSEVECIDPDTREGRNVELISLVEHSPSRSDGPSRRGSRSRSRSRHRRRRRSASASRSRSRSRSDRRRRRSRSRQRLRDRDKPREPREPPREPPRERQAESAKEKERRKKGLPPIKKGHLSVCSTTLWIGHLSKLVQQEDLSDTFGGYGGIVSIDLIPPRGCAFVCMERRQDASRALTRLNGHKIHSKTITVAWAPGKGVKGRDLKDFWEIEHGVSYIPWSRFNGLTNFVELEEGGHLDEETMPNDLKAIILGQLQKHKDSKGKELTANSGVGEEVAMAAFAGGAEGIDAMTVVALPAMNGPPPGAAPAPPSIDTSQPPPNLPGGKGMMPHLPPGMPMLGKPTLLMPPFPFANLPPPMGLGVGNLMGNLPIGVGPANFSGLMLPPQLMAQPILPPAAGLLAKEMPPTDSRIKQDDDSRHGDDGGSQLGMQVEHNDKKFRSDSKDDWAGRSGSTGDGRQWEGRRDRDRNRDDGDRGRDRYQRDRPRDTSRNRSRSRDRRHRSRDRNRASDKREDERDMETGLPAWLPGPPTEKPSLAQRLLNIAENDSSQLGSSRNIDKQGQPILMNLMNSGNRGGEMEHTDIEPLYNDGRIRALFDNPCLPPPPPFDDLGMRGPKLDDMAMFNDDRRGSRGLPDGPRLPMLGGFPHNQFISDFSMQAGPRMRFGPRVGMCPIPPHGLGPMLGVRGPRRPVSPWIDNQGPTIAPLMNDRPRNNFEDRPMRDSRDSRDSRESRGQRRRDRDGPRPSRWGKDDQQQHQEAPAVENVSRDVKNSEISESQEQNQSEGETNRETPTVVCDEASTEPMVQEPLPINDNCQGNSTPCHDEPMQADKNVTDAV